MVVGVGWGIAGRGRDEVGNGEGASTEEDDEGQIAPKLSGKASKNLINLCLFKTKYNNISVCVYLHTYTHT